MLRNRAATMMTALLVTTAGSVSAQTRSMAGRSSEERFANSGATGASNDILVLGTRSSGEVGAKTDTPLSETPQSITLVDDQRFLSQGALSVQDALRYVAGVRTEAQGLDTRGDYAFLRGTSYPTYQDGLRRSFNYRDGPRADVFTLDRVEVLRGPASVLYGQAPNGGLVNLVTKRPEFETAASAYLSYGSFDRKELGFDLTAPVSGAVAGRVIAVVRDGDTQTDHAKSDRRLVNASLRWRPSDATDVVLSAQAQNDDDGLTAQGLPYAATLRSSRNGRLRWGTQLGEPSVDQYYVSSQWVALSAEHRFSDALRVRENMRYEWYDLDYVWHTNYYSDPNDPWIDANDRLLDRYVYAERFRSKTLTSDTQVQIDLATGPLGHKLLFGVDYADQRGESTEAYDLAAPIDAFAPVYGNAAPLSYYDVPPTRDEQLGFYAQDQIRAFERLTLLVGARRDRAVSSTPDDRLRDDAWTYRAGAVYDLGHGFLPYVSYTESFLPIGRRNRQRVAYRPTRGRQYEAGLRWQPQAGTLVSVAAYDLRDNGRLAPDPAGGPDPVQLGTVKTRGFEVEASRTVADKLDLILTYSLTRARDSAQMVGGRVATDQLASIPKHLASGWIMKTLDVNSLRLRAGAGVRYVSASYSTGSDASGRFTLATPGYAVADALVGLEHGRYLFTVNATNLTDKRYLTSCLGRGDCFVGTRRTIVGRIGYRL